MILFLFNTVKELSFGDSEQENGARMLWGVCYLSRKKRNGRSRNKEMPLSPTLERDTLKSLVYAGR